MTDFHAHVRDYLRIRRALGFKLAFHGQVLPQFASYLQAAGATTLTVELAVAWAGLPEGVKPISLAHRLGVVRGFARYLQTIDPRPSCPRTGSGRRATCARPRISGRKTTSCACSRPPDTFGRRCAR